jgi:dipeptidyl aminopeptidase/acylaminoacyl peptidase
MHGMVPEDVYELTGASDPHLSPDGNTIAYVVWRIHKSSNEYRKAIWVVPVDGSAEPRQFTAGTKSDTCPRWSPDGTKLAFVSNRSTDTDQLYVMPSDGGEPRALTDLKEDVSEICWSPDSTQIAFVARVPDDAYDVKDDKRRSPRRFTRLQFKLDNVGWVGDRRQHVFVAPADGSVAPRQVTKGDFEHEWPVWSPDGAQIAFSAGRHENWDIELATDIFVTSPEGGEPQRLTSTVGFASEPEWSPDGSHIAYHYNPAVFDEPRHTQAAVISSAGGEARLLSASLDRNVGGYPLVGAPKWSNGSVYFAIETNGNTHLYAVDAGGGEPRRIVGGNQWITGFDVRAGVLVYTSTTTTNVAELYATDTGEEAQDRAVKVTAVGNNFLSTREVIEPERFVATSSDGAEVEAWVMRPARFEDGRKYPVLLNVHGGPFTQYGNKLFDEFQVFCNAGYVVVYSNPRGSSGYSEEWGRAIMGPDNRVGEGWGVKDYEDIMAVTDEAVRRYPFCDGANLGVMGGSYGGFMTTWIIGHTDRFKAACSERAVNQWVSMYGSSDFGWTFRGYMGSFAHENLDTWIKLSPWTYATDITTPLLILHSENDLRCPIEQAEQLFTTLRLLKREVEFVRFPAEGHELSRSGNPVHRVQRFELILDFFDRHLKDS